MLWLILSLSMASDLCLKDWFFKKLNAFRYLGNNQSLVVRQLDRASENHWVKKIYWGKQADSFDHSQMKAVVELSDIFEKNKMPQEAIWILKEHDLDYFSKPAEDALRTSLRHSKIAKSIDTPEVQFNIDSVVKDKKKEPPFWSFRTLKQKLLAGPSQKLLPAPNQKLLEGPQNSGSLPNEKKWGNYTYSPQKKDFFTQYYELEDGTIAVFHRYNRLESGDLIHGREGRRTDHLLADKIDQMIELNLLPVKVDRQIDGYHGILEAFTPSSQLQGIKTAESNDRKKFMLYLLHGKYDRLKNDNFLGSRLYSSLGDFKAFAANAESEALNATVLDNPMKYYPGDKAFLKLKALKKKEFYEATTPFARSGPKDLGDIDMVWDKIQKYVQAVEAHRNKL